MPKSKQKIADVKNFIEKFLFIYLLTSKYLIKSMEQIAFL